MPEYEDIKKSDRVNSVGRVCYVERNQWVVDNSDFVVIYFNEASQAASGTMLANEYAKKEKKTLINVYF